MPGPWRKVKFAAECPACPDCGEPWCTEHAEHYGDCPCLGPTEDAEYKMVGDVLYGRRAEDDEFDETIH